MQEFSYCRERGKGEKKKRNDQKLTEMKKYDDDDDDMIGREGEREQWIGPTWNQSYNRKSCWIK